jgi:hypothetical protein
MPLPSNVVPLPMTIIMEKVGAIYGADRRWTEYEVYTLAEIARQPTALAECEAIVAFKASLPPGSRMFPMSVMRLLEKWTEILDRARMHAAQVQEQAGAAQKILWHAQLKRVEADAVRIRKAKFDGEHWDSEVDRDLYRARIAEKKDLLAKLGFSV